MLRQMMKAKAGEGEEEREVLRTCHWPEPYSFDATDDRLKAWKDTSFDEEGIQAAIGWLNQAYKEHYR